jgi:MYXO-CTERM domain-containing protein
MRRAIAAVTISAAIVVLPVSDALATTPPNDPDDVESVDNPLDENDDGGFDDWGLLGLLGLAGLAGLKRRDRVVRTDYDAQRASR